MGSPTGGCHSAWRWHGVVTEAERVLLRGRGIGGESHFAVAPGSPRRGFATPAPIAVRSAGVSVGFIASPDAFDEQPGGGFWP